MAVPGNFQSCPDISRTKALYVCPHFPRECFVLHMHGGCCLLAQVCPHIDVLSIRGGFHPVRLRCSSLGSSCGFVGRAEVQDPNWFYCVI